MDKCNWLLCEYISSEQLTTVILILATLTAAYIGGRMTRKATIEGVKQAHALQIKADEEAERKLINGFIWSIHAEVSALKTRYMNTMGNTVETSKEDEPLIYIYKIQEGYFTIFNNNSELIGRITDSELRVMMVNLYITGKGMVDTFRTNNEFVLEYDKIFTQQQIEYTVASGNVIKARELQLSGYANIIRTVHYEFKQHAESLLSYIEANVSKH